MAKAKQFINRLQFFAESFTGYPVSIVVPSLSESKSERAQVQNSMKIYIPREVESKNDEVGFNYYKGLVSLQSSAVLYKGVADVKELSSKLHFGEDLERFVIEGECGGLIPLTFQTIELTRRMQCISKDYKFLGEDIREGFRDVFNPEFLRKSAISDSERTPITNEMDLALSSEYWKVFGVNESEIKKINDRIERDYNFGIFREEIQGVLEKLICFENPLETSYQDSINRVNSFVRYLEKLAIKDLGMFSVTRVRNPLQDMELAVQLSKSEYKIKVEDNTKYLELNKKYINERKKELEEMLVSEKEIEIGLESKDDIKRRLSVLEKRENILEGLDKLDAHQIISRELICSQNYTSSQGASLSFRSLFNEIPIGNLIKLEVPEVLEEGSSINYFPELREGVLVPKAVRMIVYDLNKNQPPTEQQIMFQSSLEFKIEDLEKEIAKHNKKIHSDVNYIYEDLPDILRKRDHLKREVNSIKKKLENSRKIYDDFGRKDIEFDHALVRRIEREMEAIKPSARSLVRNCFEGELDEKKFYEWWIDIKSGGDKLPNFYYQWQKRKRDVASVLLIDASQSTDRLAVEGKTILDLLKESSYYFCLASQFLDDKSAVLAYNGRGDRNSRIFLLKDFYENQKVLYERLKLLRGELNNRDGSAIRFAVQHLLEIPSKTKFLFHLGDMKPSDLELEYSGNAVTFYRYEGKNALEDVANAFDFARASGVIPIGICYKPKVKSKLEEDNKGKKREGSINLSVLKKLKAQVKSTEDDLDFNERLRRNFQRNYKIVEDPSELPKSLRDVYIRTSFG